MSDEEARERARESAEEAGRTAEERAEKEAERIDRQTCSTAPMKQELLRQQGLSYGGIDPCRRVHGAAVPDGTIARHVCEDQHRRVRGSDPAPSGARAGQPAGDLP